MEETNSDSNDFEVTQNWADMSSDDCEDYESDSEIQAKWQSKICDAEISEIVPTDCSDEPTKTFEVIENTSSCVDGGEQETKSPEVFETVVADSNLNCIESTEAKSVTPQMINKGVDTVDHSALTGTESEGDKLKVQKRIDFGSPEKQNCDDNEMGSPLKTESPLKVINSPSREDAINLDYSPMKLGTPDKQEDLTHPKTTRLSATSPRKPRSASKQLKWSPSKRSWAPHFNNQNYTMRLSPRRPTQRPLPDFELMSPPRDVLKRRRPLVDSPGSSIGSPGSDSSLVSPLHKRGHMEYETDADILRRRQKDIDYGKNTESYRCYLQSIPKNHRSHRHPQTPPREFKYSRRQWDGMVRSWRQRLHLWDPPQSPGTKSLDLPECCDSMSETSEESGSVASDQSFPGCSNKQPQRPVSILSLDEFPPLC